MLDLRYKTILKVAVPLMVSSFIQSVVMLTDAAFLARLNDNSLSFDANGNAGLIFITLITSLTGISDGAQILIARRIGENRPLDVGRIVRTNFLTLAIIGILLFCVLHFIMPDVIPSFVYRKELADAEISFLNIRSYALLVAVFNLTFQSFFYAIGKTWVMLISALIIAFSNIIMDYLFVFGAGFIPKMGLEGAAIASTLAEVCGMIFLFTFFVFSKEAQTYQVFGKFKLQIKYFYDLFRIGSPMMMQAFSGMITWTVFFVWIEQRGGNDLTVSQNLRSIYFLAFIPIWGFAATTKTYISQYLGRKDYDALKTIQNRIILLSILFITLFLHGAFLYPEKLIAIINPEEAHIAKSAEILQFVALSIFAYSLASVKLQTINGSGNTQVTLFIEVISVLIYLGYGYFMLMVIDTDIFWVWSVEYIYFCSMGIMALLYMRFFNWKNKTI